MRARIRIECSKGRTSLVHEHNANQRDSIFFPLPLVFRVYKRFCKEIVKSRRNSGIQYTIYKIAIGFAFLSSRNIIPIGFRNYQGTFLTIYSNTCLLGYLYRQGNGFMENWLDTKTGKILI